MNTTIDLTKLPKRRQTRSLPIVSATVPQWLADVIRDTAKQNNTSVSGLLSHILESVFAQQKEPVQ